MCNKLLWCPARVSTGSIIQFDIVFNVFHMGTDPCLMRVFHIIICCIIIIVTDICITCRRCTNHLEKLE